jgi:hypothetical protein
MSITKPFALLLTGLLSTVGYADTLSIPGHYEDATRMVMPQRGLKMDQVLSEFGEPENRKGPVGEPPITEWDYGDFRVYFEYQTVLHSVDLTTMIMPR